MLSIKLRPIGKKKQISYRVVVMPKRSKLLGRFVDDLGWYNPHTNRFKIEKEKALKWISQGAQPTESVHNILVSAGIVEGNKKAVHAKSKKEPVNEEEKKEEGVQKENSDEKSVEEQSSEEETPQKEEKEETPQETEKEGDEKESKEEDPEQKEEQSSHEEEKKE